MIRSRPHSLKKLNSHLSHWQKSAWLIFCGVALLNILIGSVVYFRFPEYVDYLRKEDCLTENTTVAIYLLTFFTSLFLTRKRPANKPMLISLGILSIFLTLEELSYGQRIFGYEAIATFYNEPLDCVHDLFKIGFLLLRKFFYPHKLAAASFLMCSFLLMILLKIRLNLRIPSALSPRRYMAVYICGLCAAGLFLCALLFDLARFDYLYLYVLEELFELNGALALLTATICAKKTEKTCP